MGFDFGKFKDKVGKLLEGVGKDTDTLEKVGFDEGIDDGVVLSIFQLLLATQDKEFCEKALEHVMRVKMILPSDLEEFIYLDEAETAIMQRLAYLSAN
jgi:hypothetical protein